MNYDIRPLSKALKNDYLNFFDHMVFEENPDRSKCYCCDYHFLGDAESCTREISRPFVANLIDENKFAGYLVFDNDEPIAWCNANNRSNYQRLLRDFDLVDNPDDVVCSIVCFLVHPDYRRLGIAQKILEKIIEDSTAQQYDYVEAYPRKGELTSEGNFKGPLELYKRMDFIMHKEHNNYYVMRKSLG
ncbi:MAG: GNAT family N-acetyltransferase [Schleiferiaceae bacterium]|nr:GNAT family N-acetyltransferase [Schleiferiaceae bacterium]